MANHHGDGSGMSPAMKKFLAEAFNEAGRPDAKTMFDEIAKAKATLGKQNDFPAGQYGASDQGSLMFALAADKENGKVKVDFGTPVKWMAMDPEQAIHFAEGLIKAARESSKKPLTVSFSRR